MTTCPRCGKPATPAKKHNSLNREHCWPCRKLLAKQAKADRDREGYRARRKELEAKRRQQARNLPPVDYIKSALEIRKKRIEHVLLTHTVDGVCELSASAIRERFGPGSDALVAAIRKRLKIDVRTDGVSTLPFGPPI